MAQHTIVSTKENESIILRALAFIDKFADRLDNLEPFLRYDEDCKLMDMSKFNYKVDIFFQKLTDRYETDDDLVLSISPVTFNVYGEIIKNANAEIHFHKFIVNKLYMVY